MRVLISCSFSPSLVNFRGELIKEFMVKGYEVHVSGPDLLNDKELCGWLRVNGVIGHNVDLERTGFNPISDLKYFLNIFRLINRIKPNLFFAYTAKPVIWGGFAASISKVPVRVFLITGLGYAFIRKNTVKSFLLRLLMTGLYRLALARATLVFFQNKDDRLDFIKSRILSDDSSSIIVNGSGVDTKYYSPTPFKTGKIVFLLIARLLVSKGIREYVTAAKRIRNAGHDVEFHLVGAVEEGPDQIPIEEIYGWQKSDIVKWMGQVKDVRPFISASHVYVLPSYREGTPRSVLEAMSMGRPIITTDTPGCRETVEENINGFLVKVSDVDALKNAMLKFIEDRTLIKKFGRNSRHIVKQKFDVDKVNDAILTAIEQNNRKL